MAVKCFSKAFRRRRPDHLSQRLPYTPRKRLLSSAELLFLETLRNVDLGREFHISFKVRLADVIKCPDESWHTGYGQLVAKKHIDFVLTDFVTTQIIAGIELDDSSHELRRSKVRDGFVNRAFAQAGTPLLRFQAKGQYNEAEISTTIRRLTENFERH